MTASNTNSTANCMRRLWIETKHSLYILSQSLDGKTEEELVNTATHAVYRGTAVETVLGKRLLFLFSEKDAEGDDHVLISSVRRIEEFQDTDDIALAWSL